MHKSIIFRFLLLMIPVLLSYESKASEPQQERSMPEYQGKVNAPEFPAGMEWLNTDRPLTIRGLRGKIVLLDFWTYCCINCIHIIPDLKKLEKKYANELVVIGVHSAKFTTEQETDNIRQAILRYEIEHPVVNDYDMEIWRRYAARAWPTLMLIDPEGKVIGYTSGEGIYDPMDKLIGKVIETFDPKKKIDRRPLNLKLERQKTPSSMLAFPGKVLADEKTKQLFVADSNHNRIVVISLETSEVLHVIGSGEIGLKDGSFESAEFNHPQGMAFDGKSLFVADTENHAIRRIDFDKRAVSTLAGTGEQATRRGPGGPGLRTQLNSPWDLVLHGNDLFIAMAGPHQLWKLDLTNGKAAPFAGTGAEARIDGPLRESALAQPSGITTDGKKLYFADSEVSAIRSADIDPNGRVSTIVGEDLFEFGDKDGKGAAVRLQHPLGVVHHNGALYVADTYNNKIKLISPEAKTSTTFLGTGVGGYRDGISAHFDEPAGLSIAFGKIYIADTNNHAIRVADLNTRKVETLAIKGLDKLRPRARSDRFFGEVIQLNEQEVEPGEGTLRVELQLPAGYKLNGLAPSAVTTSSSNASIASLVEAGPVRNPSFPLELKIRFAEGQASVKVNYLIYYCEAEKETLCYFKEVQLTIPVKVVTGSAKRSVSASYRLSLN